VSCASGGHFQRRVDWLRERKVEMNPRGGIGIIGVIIIVLVILWLVGVIKI
jgi:hypothetical protein